MILILQSLQSHNTKLTHLSVDTSTWKQEHLETRLVTLVTHTVSEEPAYEEPPNDAVDFKAGDLVDDDDATISDDGPKETGEF